MREVTFADMLDAVAGLGNDNLLTTLGTLAGIGAVAMALVQLVKELSPMRSCLQRRWLVGWLNGNPDNGERVTSLLSEADFVYKPLELLLTEVTVGGASAVMFELPGDEMMAQVLRAAPVMLDNPLSYGHLIARLAHGADDDDLSRILSARSEGDMSGNLYFDARSRLLRRVERNLEGASLELTSRWRFWMHLASIVATFVVVIVAWCITEEPLSIRALGWAFVIAVLGGYFAPVAKDIVATLRDLRARL